MKKRCLVPEHPRKRYLGRAPVGRTKSRRAHRLPRESRRRCERGREAGRTIRMRRLASTQRTFTSPGPWPLNWRSEGEPANPKRGISQPSWVQFRRTRGHKFVIGVIRPAKRRPGQPHYYAAQLASRSGTLPRCGWCSAVIYADENAGSCGSSSDECVGASQDPRVRRSTGLENPRWGGGWGGGQQNRQLLRRIGCTFLFAIAPVEHARLRSAILLGT